MFYHGTLASATRAEIGVHQRSLRGSFVTVVPYILESRSEIVGPHMLAANGFPLVLCTISRWASDRELPAQSPPGQSVPSPAQSDFSGPTC